METQHEGTEGGASCDDAGDLMHPAGPPQKSEPRVPESVIQIPRPRPTDSTRGATGKRV